MLVIPIVGLAAAMFSEASTEVSVFVGSGLFIRFFFFMFFTAPVVLVASCVNGLMFSFTQEGKVPRVTLILVLLPFVYIFFFTAVNMLA